MKTTAQNPYFIHYFGTPLFNEQARAIQQLPDGSIYLAGYSNASGNVNPAVIKLNVGGDSLWMKTYGDSTFSEAFFMNRSGATDLVLVGEQTGNLTGTDVMIIKIDSAGNVLWKSVIATAKNESGKYIEQTQDGGFILCGFQSDDFGFNDIFLAKLDATGALSWTKKFGGIENDYANQVHEQSDGSLILTADTRSKGAGGYDVEVLKLSPAGDMIWDYTYGDEFENGCQGICLAANGDLISYGETEIAPFSPFDFFIQRIDQDGTSLWKKVFGGSGSDAAFSIVEDDGGNLILTGYSNSNNVDEPIDIAIAKTDATGNLLWINNYGTSGIDIGYGIIKAENGFLIVATAFNEGSNDFCLLYLSAEGLLTGANQPLSGQENQHSIFVYPNPSTGLFTITFNEAVENGSMRIFSVLGAMVFESEIANRATHMKLALDITPGIYKMLIQSESGNRSITIEVQ
ncbi:MAG: T9SS type A sorting domain-containing protein [Chitinophagales bacterium]